MIRIKDWKLLLIDEDDEARQALSAFLADADYSVLTVADGESGIELCREQSPQIIITEINLPGIDGIEVLKTIKKAYPYSEVIVTSAHNEIENALKSFRLDAADFITKPINEDTLMAALERAKKRYNNQRKLQDYTVFLEERWMDTSEELAKIFSFQERLIESSIDGIIGCDYDRKIIIFNNSMEEMLGYSKDMVSGKMFFYQLFSSREWERFQDQLYSEELGGEDKLFLSESILISKKGEKIPVRLSAQVLLQENEEIGLVAFFRDLRKVKRLKQQFLDQAQYLHQDKMISLGKLAASVVHELNNPLTGILNYVRLMIKILGRGSLSTEQIHKFQRYLDLVGSEVSRSSDIVSNLLAFSRKPRMEFSEVNIDDLLEKSILLCKYKLTLQNIQIKTNLYPKIPTVFGDFNQLQQCLLNLIFNAADAMPDGGSLTVASSFFPHKGLVEIKVTDTGRGISREDLSKVFDPFFSTKEEGKGLGLGLSVVHAIIDRHKGTISAESTPGKGTVFTITLPVKGKVS
ncbi:MAG: response regulator [Deltaproteobacteria bacterium]|nr:response regulator [Deltaproteobacteria bacterium]